MLREQLEGLCSSFTAPPSKTRFVYVVSTLAALMLASPADAYRDDTRCFEILQFMGARPAGMRESLWLSLSGFYSGLALGVEILHPEARGDFDTVRARLKATCEEYPLAHVGAVLRRFALEVQGE
jgi:hypothetical protein